MTARPASVVAQERSVGGWLPRYAAKLFDCYIAGTRARSWERVSGRCLAGAVVWDDPVSGGEAGEWAARFCRYPAHTCNRSDGKRPHRGVSGAAWSCGDRFFTPLRASSG